MHAAQVVVASKFDNRMKEFGERWEVDRYLSAAGYLSASVRPFFVALPKVCPALPCPDSNTGITPSGTRAPAFAWDVPC